MSYTLRAVCLKYQEEGVTISLSDRAGALHVGTVKVVGEDYLSLWSGVVERPRIFPFTAINWVQGNGK